jgi:hypothetical protein
MPSCGAEADHGGNEDHEQSRMVVGEHRPYEIVAIGCPVSTQTANKLVHLSGSQYRRTGGQVGFYL